MRELVLFSRTFFSLNPTSVAHYSDWWVLALFGVALACIVGSFLLKAWHRKQQSVTRKLSAGWSSVSFWFGIVALLLVVSRVERIQVLAMPFLWALWILAALAYIFIQWRKFRAKHYEIIPQAATSKADPYLVSGKRKR